MKKYFVVSVLIAAAYLISGILGLKLAVPPGYATAVFPSSGIALAALLLLGRIYWPAIFLGSTLMNFVMASQNGPLTQNAVVIGIFIGFGAALQAVTGEILIKKYVPNYNSLIEEKNILRFLAVVGPVSCLVNSSYSVSLLWFFDVVSGAGFFYNWSMWYVGDAIGAMIFTPLVLALAQGPRFEWNSKKKLLVLPSIVLFSFVVWFFFFTSNQLSEKFRRELQNEGDVNAQRIVESMDHYRVILAGVERLFASSRDVTRQEFRDFLEKSLKEYRGIRAISWNPRVTSADRAAVEKLAVKNGLPNYYIKEMIDQHIRRAPERETYYPILYVEPFLDNEDALGFNPYSSPERHKAIRKSFETKGMTISPKIQLVQDRSQIASMAMYYPVFKKQNNIESEAGVIVGVFRFRDLIQLTVSDLNAAGLNFFIYDITDKQKQLLYADAVDEEDQLYSSLESIEKNRPRNISISHTVAIGGRVWQLELIPSKQYISAHADLSAWAMLLGGLLVVILLQSLMMVIIGRAGTVERLVEEKTLELSKANLELEKLTKLKSAFLANMSHEIRTPINGVVGMTSLLRDTSLNQEQVEYVENITTSANSLLGLINDILDFSKVEAGKLSLEIIDFDFERTIRETAKTIDFIAKRKNLPLVLDLSDMPTKSLRGDPGRLGQVMVNLLNNAVKFTPEGQITLKVIQLRAVGNKRFYRFEVKDTGIGIEENVLEKIFLPFDQADSSTTRKYGGTGLGLSICKHLVELMGGQIGVYSRVNQGSTFWFEMLFEEGEIDLANLRRDDKKISPEAKGLKILLAEDNQINQLVAMKQLQNMGCQCDAVANGKEAIEALRNITYDLVLMDCQMPEMDGYEATRTIRSLNETFSDIPIIAMTANAMKGDREKCIEAGMNDYVTKPIAIADLSEVIKVWAKTKPKDV